MRRQRSALLLLPALIVVVAACGADDTIGTGAEVSPPTTGMVTPPTTEPATTQPATTLSPPTTNVLPATTLVRVPVRNDALLDSIEPTIVTEPCPDSPGGPDGTEAMQTELAKLEPMLGVAVAYGGDRPDVFGSYGLVWHGTNDASVFVSFTSNLDVHRAALNDMVAHPEELIVCQVAVSGEVSQALIGKLTDELDGRFHAVSLSKGGVEVVLKTGEQTLADQLIATYGSAVSVTICADDESCTLEPMLMPVPTVAGG